WTDSLIAGAFVGLLLALQRRRARWLGAVLGLFLGFKPYSVVALPLLFRAGRVSRRAWIEGLALAVATALPFFVWGPPDFVNDVVLFQLRQPFRREALSLPAYLFKVAGWQAPGALAVVGAGAARARPHRAPGPGSGRHRRGAGPRQRSTAGGRLARPAGAKRRSGNGARPRANGQGAGLAAAVFD